ncbi:MAG: putative ATP-dependent helicase DinG [bacterium]|nr:putative ATP-dependent helicase DinG [bacterium]
MFKSTMKLPDYLAEEAVFYMRHHIQQAGGNEVFFVGKANPNGLVETVQVVARGNKSMVPAIVHMVHAGDVVIHNHPSGVLQPSHPDANLASELGNEAVGFYIINNHVTEIYVVVEPQKQKQLVRLEAARLQAFIGPAGPLAKRLENFESRPSQQQMLAQVAEAFNDNKVAVIEAGTGIGKTLAYLVPAIEWSVRNRERTVVATGTINLQEQLINKDIPLLQAVMRVKFRAELVKGRTNYACRRKLQEVQSQPDLFTEANQKTELQSILEWAGKTAEGSKSDLGFLPSEAVWEKIQSESDTTLRSKCPYYNECFFYNARRRAAGADVLIANHHLLFADLAVRDEHGGSEVAVLPKYQRVILDEAHDLEEVASSYFGAATSYHALLRTIHKLYRNKDGKQTGVLPFALSKLQKRAGIVTRSLLERFREQIELVCAPALENLEHQLGALMQRLFAWGAGRRQNEYDEVKIRLTPAVARDRQFHEIARHQVPLFLKDLRDCVEAVTKVVKLCDLAENYLGSEAVSMAVDIQAQAQRLEEMAQQIEQVLLSNDESLIRWLEMKASRYGNLVRLRSAPLDIAPILQKAVFERFPTVILTSATLAVGDSFGFLEQRLGLRRLADTRRSTVKLSSPFDYARQVLLAIPTDMPEPNQASYSRALQQGLAAALEISNGRAFILFTSYGLLNQMHNALAGELAANGILALKQGTEGRHQLLERFRKQVGSVLFATDSFWQGVDVHGEALECVIIPRLPFRVPTEPIIEARVEAIDKSGGNSFMEYSVPQAVIKLKQGFGRLIRRKTDFGAIVIFDNRIVTKRYGQVFLESLPECRTVVARSEEVFEEMTKFYRAQRG